MKIEFWKHAVELSLWRVHFSIGWYPGNEWILFHADLLHLYNPIDTLHVVDVQIALAEFTISVDF